MSEVINLKSILFLLSTTFMNATPLIFAGLGGVISEKSGVINIGLEGKMTIGAFVASWIAITTGNPWYGLIAGGLAGALLGLVHAIATIKYKGNQVVSGMAINFIGPGLAIFLCRIFFDGSSMTTSLDLDNKIPQIFHQYATVYIAIILGLIIWFIFNKTTFGLRLISVGEHPKTSISVGLNVNFYRYIGVIASGFLAGLGGASLSIAIVSNFRPTLISGQGFIALAAVIFGRWNPIATMCACLFFGFSQALVVFLGGFPELNISSQLLVMLPYVLTLIILVGFMGKSTSPSALGQ